jgi:ATP-dependent Clp protease ATP-binding subunit ClpC
VDFGTVVVIAAVAGLAGGAVGAATVGTISAFLRQRYVRHAPRFVAYERFMPASTEQPSGSVYKGLDPDSRSVLTLARQEAIQNGHSHLGTEHLAMALRLSTNPVLGTIWDQLRVDPDMMRRRIEAAVPPDLGGAMPTELRSTPRLSKIFTMARKIASERKRPEVSPELLLMALADEGEGVGARVLATLGATAERIREIVDR